MRFYNNRWTATLLRISLPLLSAPGSSSVTLLSPVFLPDHYSTSLGNYPPTPPLSQHLHLLLTYGKNVCLGEGRWAVSWEHIMIQEIRAAAGDRASGCKVTLSLFVKRIGDWLLLKLKCANTKASISLCWGNSRNLVKVCSKISSYPASKKSSSQPFWSRHATLFPNMTSKTAVWETT